MTFEFCQYGYWVGPDGEVESIPGWQQHKDVAQSICVKYAVDFEIVEVSKGATASNAQDALGDSGWVSVTAAFPDERLEFCADRFNPPAQLRALMKIVKEHGQSQPGFQIGMRKDSASRVFL